MYSILHLRNCIFFLLILVVPHGDFARCFRCLLCAFTSARAKSETIIYNMFPPDIWLTPWVNETLASPVCAQNGYLIIHLLLSSWFSFSFYDSTSRRCARVKRGLWNHGGPTVVQSLGLLCLRLHSLPYYRNDSFHSSAFDHPRRRIRYSNASESACLSLPSFLLSLSSLSSLTPSSLSTYRLSAT